jgi:hypothetical protein
MKLLIFALVAGVSLGTLLVQGSEAGIPPGKSIKSVVPDSEKKLHAIMRSACVAANQYYLVQGFPTFAQSASGFTTQSMDFHTYKNPVLLLMTGRGFNGPQIGILPDSQRVFWFTNGQAFHAAEDAPSFPDKLPPKWTKDHAVSTGRGMAEIFVKPWQTHLILNDEMTSFSWLWQDIDPKTKTPIYEPGQWTIRWQRATASGIPYESDMVIVEETEADGPFSVRIYFATDYDETQSEKTVSEGTALAVAAQGCRDALIERT